MGKTISSIFTSGKFYETVFSKKVKHEIKTIEPNTKIIHQGRKHSFFCYIKSGNVNVVINEVYKNKNIHTILSTMGPGDVFGEFVIFNDMPAGADIMTVGKCEIIMIDVASFKQFLENDPEYGYQILFELLQMIVTRLQKANSTLLQVLEYAVDYQKLIADQKAKTEK